MAATLRERQRQLTRSSIQHAAVMLARQEGLDQVSVAQIAEAAGVSVRTFFNHFSTKEDVISLPLASFDSEAESVFVASADVALSDALELLAHSYIIRVLEETVDDADHLDQLLEVSRHDPKIASLMLRTFSEAEDRLAVLVGRRLGGPANDLTCRLVSAVTVSVVRVALLEWGREQHAPHKQSAPEALRAAFRTLHSVLETRRTASH